MSNGQNAVRERHLESLASAVADKFANFSGGAGASHDVFTGAGVSAAGLSGMVPAPQAGEQDRFLCGNGKWTRMPHGGSADYIIGAEVSTVEGGLWRDVIDAKPVLKLRHGDYEYNFNYDSLIYLGGESIALATVTPDTYILGTNSVSGEGGLWYEVTDAPTLKMHAGNFIYGFNYDTITYKGGTQNLFAYLPFDASATADACGNEWTLSDASSTEISTENKKFGAGSLHLNGGSLSIVLPSTFNNENWTIDFWSYIEDGSGNYMSVNSIGWAADTSHEHREWVHRAFVKKGDTVYRFLNGVLNDTKPPANDIAGVTLTVGGGFNVFYDSLRIVNGIALWTEDFVLPTAEDYL